VVLKAHHRWGAARVERFLGMFAFVIAERDSGQLVMAGDQLGIKPLYLARTARRLRLRRPRPRCWQRATSIAPLQGLPTPAAAASPAPGICSARTA